MQARLPWQNMAVNRVEKLVFCQRRKHEEMGLGFGEATLCPFAFLIFLFFKTNIQVLPLGEENTVRSLKMYFKEGLLPGLRG